MILFKTLKVNSYGMEDGEIRQVKGECKCQQGEDSYQNYNFLYRIAKIIGLI